MKIIGRRRRVMRRRRIRRASDGEGEKEKESNEESNEDKEDKEIIKENEGEDSREEEEESDKEAATGTWNIRRFEAEVNGQDIASLWEIKPFDDDLFFMSPKALKKQVEFIIDQTLTQIQTQVQFAFTKFPHQNKISTFCIVGLY